MGHVRASRATRWASVGIAVLAALGAVGIAGAGGPRLTPEGRFERAVQSRSAAPSASEAPPAKSATPIDPTGAETDGGLQAQLSGYTFTPINPYRAYDSRPYVDGFLLPGQGVYFEVLSDVNGTQQIPASAVAVTYNLTATGTFGAQGYLAVFPADINWPGNSSINWVASNQSIANGGVVALGARSGPGEITVYCGQVSLTGTDFIVDITGFYS